MAGYLRTVRGSESVGQGKSYDYSELIVNKFADRAQKEIPNWPKMSIDSVPEKQLFNYDLSLMLEFNIESIILSDNQTGFYSRVMIQLGNNIGKGKFNWFRIYEYRGFEHNRFHTVKEFTKDNNKLLIEELEYAADKTVSAFISAFINDLKNAK